MRRLTRAGEHPEALAATLVIAAMLGCAHRPSEPTLVAYAALPAATFAEGPSSGSLLGDAPINAQPLPFTKGQPVQGFSALVPGSDGSFLALVDNGYGTLETSADFHLRVYRLRAHFRTRKGGVGKLDVEGFIELRDPDGLIPFTIVNALGEDRILTGADLDLESMQRAPDGTLWFGDEFGPFLIHTDSAGVVLDPPYPLPDPDGAGRPLRSPQNPGYEEMAPVRLLNAFRRHAQRFGATTSPTCSPSHLLLADGDASTTVATRADPGSPSSEIFDVGALRRAGFPVIPWTINEVDRMRAVMRLGVDGIITDRPDRLQNVLREGHARSSFDAQGHRGARGLRPENTLPSMEAALDHLVTTLETDTAITADGVVLLNHDPEVSLERCRPTRARSAPNVLIKASSAAEIQRAFVCDGLVPRFPDQRNALSLSPVSVAFAEQSGLPHAYAMPTLTQLFELVTAYATYYESGPGRSHAEAKHRARNARRVRFNIEIKTSPETAAKTIAPDAFARAVARAINGVGMLERSNVQSFDFRPLLVVQRELPGLRTAYLFEDLPAKGGAIAESFAGLAWPHRQTTRDQPPRVQTSAGLEGLALTADGKALMPMLERPLIGEQSLRVFRFDLMSRRYAPETFTYALERRGNAVGAFQLHGEGLGLVIERDDSEGDLGRFKRVYEIVLKPDRTIAKRVVVDLLDIADPDRLAGPGHAGDVGLGERFALPYFTIEGLAVLSPRRIGVINDNNFPIHVGRHLGTGLPDDTELVVIELPEPLRTQCVGDCAER